MDSTRRPGNPLTTVREIMRRDFVHAAPEESLGSALQSMRLARLRHLPVVRGGALLGILSYRDLLEQLALPDSAAGEHLQADDVMHEPPICVSPEDSLSDAADRMCRYRVGCLPVVDEGRRLLGLVTESDLLRAAYGLRAP
jgi:CBS domain-containing protein